MVVMVMAVLRIVLRTTDDVMNTSLSGAWLPLVAWPWARETLPCAACQGLAGPLVVVPRSRMAATNIISFICCCEIVSRCRVMDRMSHPNFGGNNCCVQRIPRPHALPPSYPS